MKKLPQLWPLCYLFFAMLITPNGLYSCSPRKMEHASNKIYATNLRSISVPRFQSVQYIENIIIKARSGSLVFGSFVIHFYCGKFQYAGTDRVCDSSELLIIFLQQYAQHLWTRNSTSLSLYQSQAIQFLYAQSALSEH
jgi:hypothetical protein